MPPPVVDQCDLWEAAAVLGFHEPPEGYLVDVVPDQVDPEHVPSRRDLRPRPATPGRRGVPTDTISARMRHHQDPERYPAPVHRPTSAGAILGLTAQAGIQIGPLREVTDDAD